MKVLIIGSEGNIGKPLVARLQEKGYEVFCVDIVQKMAYGYKTVDINIPGDMDEVFRKFEPSVVYHLAGVVSRVVCERSPVITIQTNVIGTYNIIQLCKRYDAGLIFFSTSEVYGNIGGALSEDRTDLKPNNLYGLSKLLAEELIHYEVSIGLKAVIVRPFMIYHEDEKRGDNHSAVIRFCEALTKKQKITVHKNSTRPWTHISDAVDLFEKLLYISPSTIKNVINIGSPELISTEDLACLICNKLKIDYCDYVILEDLPAGMTLEKNPSLYKQFMLIGKTDFVKISEGIDRVLSKMI